MWFVFKDMSPKLLAPLLFSKGWLRILFNITLSVKSFIRLTFDLYQAETFFFATLHQFGKSSYLLEQNILKIELVIHI